MISDRLSALLLHPVLRAALLALLCLAFFLPGQMGLPPVDRDEARFAQASKQMVESGDYTDIRFQEVPRHKKPIGIYWLQSLSVTLSGAPDAIWPYRAVSWMGALFAVVVTASVGSRMFGPAAGWLAGLMLASCLLLNVEARMAKTDAALLFTIVVTLGVLAKAYLERCLSRGEILLFWLMLGAGTLIKGPIILLAVLGPLLWLGGRDRSLRWFTLLQPKFGVIVYLLVVLPWLIAITIRSGGAFWQESVGQDLLAKAAGVQESHGGKPGYYLLSFFFTFWPWAFLLFPLVPYVWKQRGRDEVAFCVGAIVPFWLVFELFPTKLLHYTLPTFPFIALLMAALLTEGGLTFTRRLHRGWLMLGACLAVVLALLLPFVPVGLAAAASGAGLWDALTSSPPSFAALLAAFLLTGLLVMAWRAAKRGYAVPAVLATVLGLVAVYAASFGLMLPGAQVMWPSRAAAALIVPQMPACTGPLVSVGYNEPSLVFLTSTQLRLREAETALAEIADSPCALLLVDGQNRTVMENGFAAQHRQAIVLGTVAGFNYAKGDPVTLTLFRTQPEPTP